ncbi:uncharacterized protein with ParB-like and HNH nuclease domain [Flavobacterium sp. PL11]|uniref:DUF262 domain-containing protein n=1 Tax=Flavobacterium sp. PL11 TaxID=3071717 RepID=UPI002DF9B344|nr:uncharacterized protein with ParB-like and HNH nuclease domain [Flavobacterium sp. PL11]
MDSKFKTEVVSLESLDNYNFSIPTYQRPYVWGDEQLKKMLDDFYSTFQHSKDSIYYVSNFLTKEEENHAELIDGQQRFTTLWLISFVINTIRPESNITKFLKKNNQLRLGFEIRKEVSEFLESLLEDESVSKKIYDNQFIIEYPYLKNIAKALVFINGYMKQIPENEIELFGNYIYTNVKLIKNTTSKNTDLNKLFSTINSAGIQLEQTDIVKANLLSLIDDKVKFGKIWETCENMNNFFERNARTSFPSSDWSNIHLDKVVSFDDSIFKYESNFENLDINSKIFSIDNLDIKSIPQYQFPQKIHLSEGKRESDEIFCRSIISFGQLLLHTYRIHLKKEALQDFDGTFHVSRIIEIFKALENRNNPDEIKRFILLLWEVRHVFDKYIIKWISDVDTKTESLELVNVNRNQENYYSRSKYEKSASLMLQSILYFTGDYLRQYWLTTYLGYLLNKHNNLAATENLHLKYLERIDNIFSTTKSTTDKELSWKLLEDNETIKQDFNIELYLASSLGTKFKHYWFQKLEYILWKNWEFDKNTMFNNFRIMSKNSVEHIYPQDPENKMQHPEIDDVYLHSFGNLVLLSVSQNSEYSNKSVNVKRSMFNEKGDSYDTLKSFYIFNSFDSDWNTNEIVKHEEEMINKIFKHYKND